MPETTTRRVRGIAGGLADLDARIADRDARLEAAEEADREDHELIARLRGWGRTRFGTVDAFAARIADRLACSTSYVRNGLYRRPPYAPVLQAAVEIYREETATVETGPAETAPTETACGEATP